MQRYFSTSFWASAILIVALLTSCKNSTGPEKTNPEQKNPTDPEQTNLEITSNASFSIDENQTTVDTITATPESDKMSFSITGGTDQNHFSIDGSSGALTFNTAPDFENPADANGDNTYELTIEVSADGASASKEVTVSVTDIDEDQAPTITSNASFSVEENTTAVDTVTASDPNGDPITFSITSGTDQDQFSIDASSGALAFNTAPDFENPADANTDNSYQIEVEASDGQHSVSQNLSVNVTDVNENNENQAPSITSGANFDVEEGTTTVTTVTASDPDGNPIAFSISGGTDASEFSIGKSSGELTFNSAPDFEAPSDANTDNTYEIEVQASDGSRTATQNLSITVTDDGNQSPTFTSISSVGVAENTTAVHTITATDPEYDSITFSISGGTDASEFSIGESSGELTFNSAPDFEAPSDANTDNTYKVQVQASDGSMTAVQNLSITVTDVNENEAPSFTSISSVGVEENRIDVHTITATDPEGDSITFSISGGADANKFSIGASSGDLNFNNTHDYEDPNDANTDNVYEVQLQISDGNKTTTQNFRANIFNDPDEPGIPPIIRKQ